MSEPVEQQNVESTTTPGLDKQQTRILTKNRGGLWMSSTTTKVFGSGSNGLLPGRTLPKISLGDANTRRTCGPTHLATSIMINGGRTGDYSSFIGNRSTTVNPLGQLQRHTIGAAPTKQYTMLPLRSKLHDISSTNKPEGAFTGENPFESSEDCFSVPRHQGKMPTAAYLGDSQSSDGCFTSNDFAAILPNKVDGKNTSTSSATTRSSVKRQVTTDIVDTGSSRSITSGFRRGMEIFTTYIKHMMMKIKMSITGMCSGANKRRPRVIEHSRPMKPGSKRDITHSDTISSSF
eukprot:XP_001610251.1 hypothetical protein [Babesia bovis T2Bo]